MTALLEQALAAVAQLSPAEQDAIAALILDELADEQQWQQQFDSSQDKLTRLAAKVRADIKAGRVSERGWDEL